MFHVKLAAGRIFLAHTVFHKTSLHGTHTILVVYVVELQRTVAVIDANRQDRGSNIESYKMWSLSQFSSSRFRVGVSYFGRCWQMSVVQSKLSIVTGMRMKPRHQHVAPSASLAYTVDLLGE